MKKILALIPMTLAMALLFSCAATTQLNERWHDEGYAHNRINNIFIIAVTKDDVLRRTMEQHLATKLRKSTGVNAIPSYQIVTDKPIESKDDIIAATNKSHADSVFIMTLKEASTKSRYVPPRTQLTPTTGGVYGHSNYGGYGRYYATTYQTVQTPGYTTQDTIVKLESRLYSVQTEKLIWAAKTTSMNAKSNDAIIKEVVPLIVQDLKSSLLAK